MPGVVVDTSAWIALFSGLPAETLEDALAAGPPFSLPSSSPSSFRERDPPGALGELLQDAPIHDTPLDHWIRAFPTHTSRNA